MNDSLEVKPCIAKSWYISGDQRTYVFNLRDDVYFHKHKLFGNQETEPLQQKTLFLVLTVLEIIQLHHQEDGLWIRLAT